MAVKESSGKKARWRGILFRVIAILFSLLLLFAIEGLLRVFSYGNDMHLFVRHGNEEYRDFYRVNAYVGEKYFSRFEATTGTNDIFLRDKPENAFRLFVMGSSTIVGFPYGNNLMASRILHQRLQDAYPDRRVEVVNTAITAINSVTLRDFIPQILKHEPDAILIYAGHNEYYGAFGAGSNEAISRNPFMQRLYFSMSNLRLTQLIQSGLNRMGRRGSEEDTGTLMKRMVRDPGISLGGEMYEAGIGQYELNMGEILAMAAKEGVPVLISDLVSNERDQKPFYGENEDSRQARALYAEAQQKLAAGDSAGAREQFIRARDQDPVRFRAPEELNRVITRLADVHDAFLVPACRTFREVSPGGMIGNNLITEHVHPNIGGQFLLADVFYKAIIESNVVDSYPGPLGEKSSAWYRKYWPYTRLDSLCGEYSYRQVQSHWPFTSLDNRITFRDTFRVSGVVDSMAFSSILSQDILLEDLHSRLAEYYMERGMIQEAGDEYDALAMINPYRYDYMNKAILTHFRLRDLYAAERYLRRSLLYHESDFAYGLLGEIEMIKHNYPGAIEAFEAAMDFLDPDKEGGERHTALLKKLYTLYHQTGQHNMKEEIHREMTTRGLSPGMAPLPDQTAYSKHVPLNIEIPFRNARSHFDSNPDSAMYYLHRCLDINDCPLVNRFMGDLFYRMQDPGLLPYYQKAYPAYRWEAGFLAQLTVAYLANGDSDHATAALSELQSLDPTHPAIAGLQASIQRAGAADLQ